MSVDRRRRELRVTHGEATEPLLDVMVVHGAATGGCSGASLQSQRGESKESVGSVDANCWERETSV